jgi:hypothetical protein
VTFDEIPQLPSAAPPPLDRRASIQFVQRVRDQLGARHGGTWYAPDEEGRPAYFFAVTDLADDDAAWVERLRRAAGVDFVVRLAEARYSHDQLLEFSRAFAEHVAEHRITGVGLAVRPDLNRLVVSVPGDRPELAQTVRSWIPEDAMLVRASDPNAHGWTLFAPPHGSGSGGRQPER